MKPSEKLKDLNDRINLVIHDLREIKKHTSSVFIYEIMEKMVSSAIGKLERIEQEIQSWKR